MRYFLKWNPLSLLFTKGPYSKVLLTAMTQAHNKLEKSLYRSIVPPSDRSGVVNLHCNRKPSWRLSWIWPASMRFPEWKLQIPAPEFVYIPISCLLQKHRVSNCNFSIFAEDNRVLQLYYFFSCILHWQILLSFYGDFKTGEVNICFNFNTQKVRKTELFSLLPLVLCT